MHFLRHEPWDEPGWWSRVITRPHAEADKGVMDRVRRLLASVMLRRTKDMLDEGAYQCILRMPINVRDLAYAKNFFDDGA